jgi:hypothetical protein
VKLRPMRPNPLIATFRVMASGRRQHLRGDSAANHTETDGLPIPDPGGLAPPKPAKRSIS